jgi:undecaprenyl-diphosphatase
MAGVGLSRAYLGVHYPSDIAAGLMLGSGWSLLVSSLFSYLRARSA